jgi:hypothetical protein
MDRAKLRSILLAVTFQNGVRVSTGKRWGGIALSVVVFIGFAGISGGGGGGLAFGTVAVYAFWVLWRYAFGYPDEFWGYSGTDTPQAVKVADSPAVETTQQPVTVIVQKKSSAAVWVLVIIVLVVILVVALGGCSLVLVPV